jgi:hypothetical protein
MAGLSTEDHEILNAAGHEGVLDYSHFEQKYRHDRRALEQIEKFKPDSLYKIRLREYTNALFREKDSAKASEIERKYKAWLQEHYPLTYAEDDLRR